MLPQCKPPGSLPAWATALLVGAVALGLAALALAPLWPGRWRSRRFGALSLLAAPLAVALAAWSLALRTCLLALLDTLTASYQNDAGYCVTQVGHGGPGFYLAQYHAWLLQTTALVDALQREALITIGASAAFLLVAGALTLRMWMRRTSRQADAGAASESTTDDVGAVHVSALGGGEPPGWLRRPRWLGRALAALLTLALIAGLGVFVALRTRQAAARTPPCSSTITASALGELPGIGLELYPTSDVVSVTAQAALTTSKQQVSPDVAANASCVVVALRRVQTSRLPELTLDQDVWAVAYHLSGSRGSQAAASAAAPNDHWLFIDAHNGTYVGGAILLSTVGG